MTTPSPRDCLLFALLSLLAACGAGGELEEDHQAATQGAEALWPGYIPYQADCSAGSFDPYSFCEPTVRDGVAEWNRRVGFLPLIPRTTETNYVAFRPSLTAGEAYSYVGMQGGLQILTVPDTGRLSTSVIGFLHEVGHLRGLNHRSKDDPLCEDLPEGDESRLPRAVMCPSFAGGRLSQDECDAMMGREWMSLPGTEAGAIACEYFPSDP